MTIYPEDMRGVGNTAEFVWFSNLFQIGKSLQETKLKILSSAYCLFFSHISNLKKMTDLVFLKSSIQDLAVS